MTILKSVAARERHARLVLVVAAAGFALAACGSSSSGAGAAPANSTPVQTSAPASAPAASSAPASSPATSAPATSGGGSSSFCDYGKVQKAQLAKDIQAYSSDTPAQLEAFEQQALNEAKTFSSSAPPAIKSAIDTAIATDQEFFSELKAVNFDYSKLSPSAVAKINTPAFTAANQTLANYFRTKCGITITP